MTNVKINVKSPTWAEDKELNTTLEATVIEVKRQIELEWPSHPRTKDQRLVYSGKLLQDESILKDVLRLTDARDENNAFSVHLVCRTTTPPPSNTSSKEGIAESVIRRRPVNNSSLTTTSSSNEQSQPSMEQNNPWSNYYSQEQTPNQVHLLLLFMIICFYENIFLKDMMMQQMYANYMTQYMQYLQSVGALNSFPASATQSLVQHTNEVAEDARAVAGAPPQVFDHVAAAAVAGAVAHGGAANNVHEAGAPLERVAVNNNNPGGGNNVNPNVAGPNVVMNAGAGGIGAMEDDDELGGGQRDVLDWFYVASRVLVLFSIVYFYSSLARFALATGLGVIIYLYNHGFFGNQQRPAERHQEAVDEVRQVAGAGGGGQPPQQQNQEEAAGAGQEVEVQVALTPEAGPLLPAAAEAVVIVDEQPHILTVVATFVTTFFTSLLPNENQVV